MANEIRAGRMNGEGRGNTQPGVPLNQTDNLCVFRAINGRKATNSDTMTKHDIAISYCSTAIDDLHLRSISYRATPQRRTQAREMTSGAFQCFTSARFGHGG
jgi:hypothetical protein